MIWQYYDSVVIIMSEVVNVMTVAAQENYNCTVYHYMPEQ